MPKYVVSSTLRDPTWTNSTVLDGDVPDRVAELRREHDGDVVVYGSPPRADARRARSRRRTRLMVFPIVLGTGKRLFGETTDMSGSDSST